MQNKYLITSAIILLVASAVYSFYHLKKTVSDAADANPKKNVLNTEAAVEAPYRDFDPAAFQADSSRKRVYYFHAGWCPDSLKIDRRLARGSDPIPDGTVIYKMDYDNEKELERTLGVKEQNTFVSIDQSGEVLGVWHANTADDLVDILQQL